MAKAPVHKLGQLIGEFIESYFEQELEGICQERQLYLDVVGVQRKARKGKKVTWYDVYGSKHDLDFVIERDGTNEKLGLPVAIIECAWRRYTKHSKNKAQEIQGAVLPIAAKYKYHKPFLGAVIAGEFTAPSVVQLNACGFETIYFEYLDIVQAFAESGAAIRYGEDTLDADAVAMVAIFEALSAQELQVIFDRVVELSQVEVTKFKRALVDSLDRQVEQVVIAPLFGSNTSFETVDDAVEFLNRDELMVAPDDVEFRDLWVLIRYSNGDKVEGTFKTAERAEKFIRGNAEY
jgi:hypothetical protein